MAKLCQKQCLERLLKNYIIGDIQRVDKVKNRYLSVAGYRLNISHPWHDCSPINEILKFESLAKRRKVFSYHFIMGLIEVQCVHKCNSVILGFEFFFTYRHVGLTLQKMPV